MATKKQKPPRPLIDEPSLLVLHEKHGELYFHIPDEETLLKVALDIVKKRLKDGGWYLDPKHYKPNNPSMMKEQIAELPEGPVKKAAQQEWSNYSRSVAQYREIKDGWDTIEKAVTQNDGRAAWQVLRDYSDGEYQRVSIERYSETYYGEDDD